MMKRKYCFKNKKIKKNNLYSQKSKLDYFNYVLFFNELKKKNELLFKLFMQDNFRFQEFFIFDFNGL